MRVKEKLLKVLPDFLDSSGYLHFDLTKPLHSMGGILEKTGQLLYAIPNTTMSEQIIGGLLKNEVVTGFIPRVICNLTNEEKDKMENNYNIKIRKDNPNAKWMPLFNKDGSPIESKPNRWERGLWVREENVKFHDCLRERKMTLARGAWYRVDVSHSQMFYLILGLWACKDNEGAKKLLVRIIRKLEENDWVIKTIENKDADEGKFYTLGNCGLRMLTIYQMGRKLGMGTKVSNWNKLLLKANLQLMSQLKIKGSNCWNTYQALKTLAEVDESYYKYIEIWASKNMNNLPKIDATTINYQNNIEEAIIFLNLPCVRR